MFTGMNLVRELSLFWTTRLGSGHFDYTMTIITYTIYNTTEAIWLTVQPGCIMCSVIMECNVLGKGKITFYPQELLQNNLLLRVSQT